MYVGSLAHGTFITVCVCNRPLLSPLTECGWVVHLPLVISERSEGEQCPWANVQATVPPPLESEQCHRVEMKAAMSPPTLMTFGIVHLVNRPLASSLLQCSYASTNNGSGVRTAS